MDWLPNLLKHLKIARSAIFAIFITAAFFIFSPWYLPQIQKPLPDNWQYVATASFIFSGCLLLIWGYEFLSRKIVSLFKKFIIWVKRKSLSELEIEVLLVLADKPTKPIDLNKLNYQSAPFTHLDLLQTSSSLQSKGLVSISYYDQNQVFLSEEGKKRAHELQKQSKSNQNS